MIGLHTETCQVLIRIFEPIEIGVVGAGLTVTAGVHGNVSADKTACDGRAENATIHVFGERLPLTVR